jgi:hypothetical protein
MNDPLATYLHDHLGGAKAAIELLEAMRDRQRGKPLGDFAVHLLADVEADRDTLQRLAEKVGGRSNAIKEFTGWLGEKAARLKLSPDSDNALETFEALEFLTLGVRGKLGMWQALDIAATNDPRLSGYDFKQLAARAETQYQEVEQQRKQIAKLALAATQ